MDGNFIYFVIDMISTASFACFNFIANIWQKCGGGSYLSYIVISVVVGCVARIVWGNNVSVARVLGDISGRDSGRVRRRFRE